MDALVYLIVLLLSLSIVVGALVFVWKVDKSHITPPDEKEDQPQPAAGAGARRAPGLRNRREGRQEDEFEIREVDQGENDEDSEEEYEEDDGPVGSSGRKKKVGAKKQAKLDAKQQKKQQMAAMEQAREERKRLERAKEQERLEKEAEEEKIRKMEEEEDERRRQAIEKKQQDEYNEWKSMFAVEESGVEAIDEAERAQQTLEMIDFCKTNKVVLLEDLVSAYKLKTAQLLELLAELDADGRLTGVVDDRGKFFHISEEEYSQITKFIERRGRISMEDLTTECNRIVQIPV